MIKRHGTKIVKIASLKLPGDIEKRKKQQHVIDLAASMEATGGEPLHPPSIDIETRRIVTGSDRMAALILLGKKSVKVELVSGDAKELMAATIVENLRRRHDNQQELTAQLVKLKETEILGNYVEPDLRDSVPKAPHRPKTAKGEAIEAVAKETGKTKEAIKKAVLREEKKAEPPLADNGCPIPTLGRPVPTILRARILRDIARIEKMSIALTQLRKDINQYRIDTPELGGRPRWDTHYGALQEAIRDSMPTMICPHCKLLDEARPCTACADMGYIGVSASKRVEAALLLEGDAAGVYIDGKWRTVYSITGEDF